MCARRTVRCYPRRMKTREKEDISHGADIRRHGGVVRTMSAAHSSRHKHVPLLVFGLLLCLFAPQCTEAVFTCPSVCTCTTDKTNSQKVQNITCSGQNLTEVPKDGKEGSDVFKLDLSGNQISSIAVTDFQYFINLVELNLSFNLISSIPDDTFSNLTNLQTVSLAGNEISLQHEMFADTTIEYLDLSSMNLQDVSKDHFKRMTSLIDINLSNNNLTSLPAELFKDLPVERVDFSHNKVSSVSDDIFNDADPLTNMSVTYVDLSNNQISSLGSRTFDDCPNLETLNLNDNQLTSLPDDLFKHNYVLDTLDLSSNQLTTINIQNYDSLQDLSVDFSDNPFECDCAVRDFLYELRNHASKTVRNEDMTLCTDTATSDDHVFLDFWDDTCSGNLGSNCTNNLECMVRNSECDPTGTECVCRSLYYDSNGANTAGGLCEPQVQLDYECKRNEACLTTNAECTSGSTKLCRCTSLYYDTSPVYLGGSCELKVELGVACSMDSMCLANYSECDASTLKCDCDPAYYDSNGTSLIGGECLLKLALYTSCNETYQCATSNAECINSRCDCSDGYYDFTDSGTCQVENIRYKRNGPVGGGGSGGPLHTYCKNNGIPPQSCGPDQFFSCSPDNSSSDASDVHFSHSKTVHSEADCEHYCFRQAAPHYLYIGAVCVCGNIDTSGTCCPYVQSPCNGLTFIGPYTVLSLAGIDIDHVPQLYAGYSHNFTVTTTLSIIDEIRWMFGDSESETSVLSSTSTVQHTYTYAGQFWLTVSACVNSEDVCEEAVIPVRVQVPPANLTTFFTGYNKAFVDDNLTDIFATYTMGYDFTYSWARQDSNGIVTPKRGCAAGWTAHRYSCIKLVTSSNMNFDDAQSACSADGGKLLQIDFTDEISEIVTALGAQGDNFLLGGQRVGGVWQWKYDGSRTVFSDSDLVSTGHGDCVLLKGGSQTLDTIDCTSTQKYACMAEPVDCPNGGNLHTDGYCYVLTSGLVRSWPDAQTDCEATYGGWLANISTEMVHNKLTDMLTAASVSQAWFGLSDRGVEGYYLWADDTSFDLANASYKPSGLTDTEDCFATTSFKTWESDKCTEGKAYFCQYSENLEHLTVPSYITGVPDVGASNGENLEQIVSSDTFTHTTKSTDVYLFPGMVFSKPGSVRSWIFHSINVSSTDTYEISLQVYRPSCSSGYLVQPGCFYTKFSTCSTNQQTCVSPNTCSDSEYFCYLSNQCNYFNQSCTCNSESDVTLSVASCSQLSNMPTYTVVGQTQIIVSQAGEKFYTVPAGDIAIQELDVVGVQVPAGDNVLHCEDVSSGLDQHTVYKATHSGWLEKNEDFPVTASTEDMTCYIQVLYTEDSLQHVPQNLGFSSVIGDYDLSISIVESDSYNLSVLIEERIEDVVWVYPPVAVAGVTSLSLGTVYTEYNQIYDFTIRVERGTNLQSTWSFDTSQSIGFTDTCANSIPASYTDMCNASLYWSTEPFATFNYNTSTVGNTTLSIQITNSLMTYPAELTILTEKVITGLGFTLLSSSRVANNVRLNEESVFEASITDGTGVDYSFTVASIAASATNASLFYTFTGLGTYNVEATAANILGSDTQSVTVYVKQPAEFANCVFVNIPYTAAVGIPATFTIQCDVIPGAEVMFKWMLSDRSNNISSAVTTTIATTETWQQSVTFSSVTMAVQMTAFALDPFTEVPITETVDVYNAIPSVDVTVSDYQINPSDVIDVVASVPTSPGTYGTVTYTFDYGDGTANQTSSTGVTTYFYPTSGNYTISVTASNGPSSQTTTQHVEVYDQVAGLTLDYDGPQRTGVVVTFTAAVTGGNFLTYQFSSSAFNVSQSSPSFTYTFNNAADYNVTVDCYNALSQMQTSITAYILEPTEIRVTAFELDNGPFISCLETGQSHQFSVEILHYNPSVVVFDWTFGNGVQINNDAAIQNEGYPDDGNFTVTVIAKYSPASATKTVTQEVCVEDRISSPQIVVATPIGLSSATGFVTEAASVTVVTGSDLHYLWSTNATAAGSTTDATFSVNFTSEGYYEITVKVSNTINSETTSTVVQVMEEISNLVISCSTCIQKAGEFYVETTQSHTYTVSIGAGSSVTYDWDWGDSHTTTGVSNTHTYGTVGSYNLTVLASNPVMASHQTYVTIHVETDITQVTVATSLYDWLSNKLLVPSYMNLDFQDTAVLKADVQPPNMKIEYDWIFDTGMTPVTSSSELGYYNYTTTGLKSCTVTATNTINTMTSSILYFYIIQDITEVNVTENGHLLSTTVDHIVALNRDYTFTAASAQFVTDTEEYFYTVKKNGMLASSSTDRSELSFTYNFTEEASFDLTFNVISSLTDLTLTYTVEAIKEVQGPFITSSTPGADGNITLSSSVTLSGSALEGKYLEYSWYYSVAPAGEAFPSSSSGQNVTVTPGSVGIYVITLDVYNSVSSPKQVNYTLNVMVGVSGVAIVVTLPYPDAVEEGSTLVFTGSVVAGTDLTYSWDAVHSGSSVASSSGQTFTVPFTTQAVYNVTLYVENYASSGLAYMEIFSLYVVPAFNIQVTGASYESTINQYVATTGDLIDFTSTISNTDFMDFNWTVNGTSNSVIETFQNTFTSPAEYVIVLNASNRISDATSDVAVLIQDAITGLNVQFCHATFEVSTSVTLMATVASGTGVIYEWAGDGLTTSSTSSYHAITFTSVGDYNVNVTASNYISQQIEYCTMTILGRIANLVLTKSQYQLILYPVTFTVTGDFLDPANFTWTFSHGVTQTTTVPTLDVTFTNAGTYDVTVTVSNAVSNDTVAMSFYVDDFVCSVPLLEIDGSLDRTTFRARPVELAVKVSTNGCTNYTSVNTWTVYTAASCSDALSYEYPLSTDILTNTPVLQLPGATLDYGSYCISFKHNYANTPVEDVKLFNVTIEASDLKALISGGEELSVAEGSTLSLDASQSYDPDNSTGTSLTYSWTCTQTMATTAAIAVCDQINALSVSTATLTGLTLTPGDVYTVTVMVSSAGRVDGTATQVRTIASGTTPVVGIKCVTCLANGHFYMTASKSLSIEGTCVSGCTATTSYQWLVYQSATNTSVNIHSSVTTTGSNKRNFVLKSGALPAGLGYTFQLQATEGSETGTASFTLPPSSKPTGGICTVTPTVSVVPLQDLVRVECQNFYDPDAMSGIYYQIKISSNSGPAEKYLAYLGTSPDNEIYVTSFEGTNMGTVQVEVNVVNDYGAQDTGSSTTISFDPPILSGTQNDTVDFIVDQMILNMKTIVNQNNPVLLVQYCTAVLSFLNDQSQASVGEIGKRMAIREVIMNSLAGLPHSTIHTIQQIASTMKYITAYPEELSLNTMTLLNTEIESLTIKMESCVMQGHDQTDYDSGNLLDAVNGIQEALANSNSTSSDAATLLRFGNLDDYILDVSQNTNVQAMSTSAMIIRVTTYSQQLMLVPLKAQLADEDPIVKTLSDGSVSQGAHVSVDNLQGDFSQTGVRVIVPSTILQQSGYSEESVFQLMSVATSNPYDFGFSNTLPVNTRTLTTSFYDTSGNSVSIDNLAEPESPQMYMFHESVNMYAINSSGLVYSQDYNPLLDNFDYSQSNQLNADTEFEAAIPLPSETAAVNIQVRVNYTSSPSSARLLATLYKNGVAYGKNDANIYARPLTITKAMMDDTQYDHREYTFYIPPEDITEDDAFKIRVETSVPAEVSLGNYYTKCEYFNTNSETWETDGCTPQADSIPTVISCKCNHLTSFGGSLLVSPDQIDFTDLTQLDISSNPVAVITCSIVMFLYIVIVIACRKMDLMDVKRISLIPLCGKDGSFKYEVTIVTGRQPGAGTSANVGIRLFGEYGKSARQHVCKQGAFQRNCSDTFNVAYDVNLGDLHKVHVWHDNSGHSPSWYLDHVIVLDLQTDQKYYFFAHKWFSLQMENGTIQKEIRVAGAQDMARFGHRMNTALFNALADKHLWLSLLNRPAQSRFTRVQRATCCVTILFVFIGVNAMWYGLLKQDNSDLGWSGFGWEEIVLGLVSNVMVLPFSIGLVFMFKKSRSKANFFDKLQKPQTAQTLEIENLCGNSAGGSFESSNTGAIPYDLERESTIDSSNHHAAVIDQSGGLGGLRRSRNVTKTHRENTDDSMLQKRPSVAVTATSSKSPLWNADGIMKWPEHMPTYDGEDSRPSTSSTVAATQPTVKHPPVKPGGSTPGPARKSKTVKGKEDASQLLEYLDKLETDLKSTGTKSVKSTGSKKSSVALRKPSMQKWGSLEDIFHSDDESVADSAGKQLVRKRGSTTSQGSSTMKKFNPRADPRIRGHGSDWPKSRESGLSGTTRATDSFTHGHGNGITGALRPGYYSEMTMESRDIHVPEHKHKCTLPPWCIYIAYILCGILSVFSIIMVILYCFTFGYEESVKWLLAFIMSLLMSVLIIEPFKAFVIAASIVAMSRSVEQDEDDDYIDIQPVVDQSNEKIKDVKFKPISGFALLQAKEEGRKIHRMNVMIRQFIAYIFYLWLVMVIVYVHFHYNSYLLNKHVQQDFFAPTASDSYNFSTIKSTFYLSTLDINSYLLNKHVQQDFFAPTASDSYNFSTIKSIDEFWDWTENVFVDSLYLEDTQTDEEHGFLLGAARVRLIRGLTSNCMAAHSAERLGAWTLTDRVCYGEGQYDEDTATYAEGWNGSNSNGSWKHYSAGDLGSTHKVGYVATYGGGGYPHTLGTSYYETLTIIQDLKAKGWIDLMTRAVIFEFSLYSPGSDMTAMVSMLAEFPLTGGVMTSYEIQSQKLMWFQERRVDPLMVLQSILLLVIIYSWVHTALQIREQGRQYFKEFWNYYEMLTSLMATVSVGMYIGCVVEATNTFNSFLDDQTGFTNFERVAYVHVGTRYLQAWLLFLLMYKVVKQLRFIKFMHIYEKTLSTAVGHLLATGLIFIILLLAYAQLGYLMYGRIVAGFESVGHTTVTLIVMIRGSFDFWPMLEYHPVFSHFYVFSYYAFAYGILVALVIAILQSTYKLIKSQMYYKATLEMQDYEMIDFMLKRFKLWSGIQKPKPAFRRVRFPGLPSISSRSSSSYSQRSSASMQSAQSLSEREFSQVQLNSMMARLTPTWTAVLRRMEKIEALDKEEESLVKKAEDEMKELNWKCRINELERQTKEILNWKNPSGSAAGTSGDNKQQRQSILKRLSKDGGDRKVPATVTGAHVRTAASTPADSKTAAGKNQRPFSDQGARVEQATAAQTTAAQRRASSQDKSGSTLQKLLKTAKPSKSAWNK